MHCILRALQLVKRWRKLGASQMSRKSVCAERATLGGLGEGRHWPARHTHTRCCAPAAPWRGSPGQLMGGLSEAIEFLNEHVVQVCA